MVLIHTIMFVALYSHWMFDLLIPSKTESESIQGFGLGFETKASKGFGFDAEFKSLGQGKFLTF